MGDSFNSANQIYHTIDPALLYYHDNGNDQHGHQSGDSHISIRQEESAEDVEGFITTFDPALLFPIPAELDPRYVDGAPALDLEQNLDWRLNNQPRSIFLVGDPYSGSVLTAGLERSNDPSGDLYTWLGTGHGPPNRAGSSSPGTLSGDVAFNTTIPACGESPQFMASSSSAVQSLTSETMPGTRQNSPLDNSSQYQSGPDHSLIFHSTGAKAESKGIKTTASADHTPSLEKRLSHPLPNHTSTTNHDALHSNIPGSGVLDFSSQKKSKNSSADKGKHKRKGSFSAQGQETVLTRKKRAPRGAICVRCKIFREKCSGSFPCERCKQVTVTKWQSICVRANLTELSCYKKSLFGHRLQMHLDNVREWKASAKFKPVRIIVSAGYKPVLPLTVHEFVPIDVRLLDHMSWRVHSTDEMIRRPSPPWGLYNVVLEPSQINHFMDEMVEELLDEKTFRQKDAIWVHTFLSALNRSKSMRQDAKLLQNVLRMWAAQSLWFDRIWRVVSEGEKIKSRWQDFLNGHDVPRLLYVQLDFYMEAYIAHLETRILADLNDFIFSRSSSTWFSVYAAAFVYLVALENDSWRLETWKAKLKKWENLSSDVRSNLPAWPLPNNPNYYLEQNRYNARVVAGHIRAGCKGLFPFSMRSSGQVVANTQKTDPEIEGFVDSIQEEFNGFGQKMMLRRLVPSFRAEDVDSLDYTFVASILMDIE